MITMRSLPSGAMGPAPHHDRGRHERPVRTRTRRVHPVLLARVLLRRAGAVLGRRRAGAVADAGAAVPATAGAAGLAAAEA